MTTRKEQQQLLRRAGFYNGPIDGEVTREFIAAVTEAQKAIGTFADGLWGPATEQKLKIYIEEQNL